MKNTIYKYYPIQVFVIMKWKCSCPITDHIEHNLLTAYL